MANSIEYASKFLPVIDDIYKAESVTECLDTSSMADFSGANEIKILKVSTTGLGTYSRTGGYPKGDITAVWETMKLTQERGKEISIDRMDDEETLGMVFGTVTGNFMREWVIPELDAYRFPSTLLQQELQLRRRLLQRIQYFRLLTALLWPLTKARCLWRAECFL